MPYNIRCMIKMRDMGDTKPMSHCFFTTDTAPLEQAKARFEADQPGARFVELFEADRAWSPSEYPLIVPPTDIVVPDAT